MGQSDVGHVDDVGGVGAIPGPGKSPRSVEIQLPAVVTTTDFPARYLVVSLRMKSGRALVVDSSHPGRRGRRCQEVCILEGGRDAFDVSGEVGVVAGGIHQTKNVAAMA